MFPLSLSHYLSTFATALIVVTLGYWLALSARTVREVSVEDFAEPLRRLRVPQSWWRRELLWLQYLLHALLAAALLLGTGWWFRVGAVLSLGMFMLYGVVVVQAFWAQTSCQCFHSGQLTSRRDLARAAVLVVASGTTVVTAVTSTSEASDSYSQTLAWRIIAALVVIATMTVASSISPERQRSLKREAGHTSASFPAQTPVSDSAPSQLAGEGEEYMSMPIPRVMVIGKDGEELPLSALASERPALVFLLNPHCGGCLQLLEKLDRYAAELPEVALAVLATSDPELVKVPEGVGLYQDRNSVIYWLLSPATPSAFLLAPSQMIVGGPVHGVEAITHFVADIRAELDSAASAMSGSRSVN